MTKGLVKDNHPLYKLLRTNKISIKPEGWIQSADNTPSVQKENL